MPTPSACLVLRETQLTLAAARGGAELKTLQNSPPHYKKQYILGSPRLLPQPPSLSGTAGLQKPPHEHLSLLQHVARPHLTPVLKTALKILIFGSGQATGNLCQEHQDKQL